MFYASGKAPLISRECYKKNVALVVVGFPATSLTTARARVCISASHSMEDLDFGLDVRDIQLLLYPEIDLVDRCWRRWQTRPTFAIERAWAQRLRFLYIEHLMLSINI